MATQETEAERKLKKLGEQLQKGWAALHEITPEEKERARQAAREQWEQQAQQKEQLAEERRQAFAELNQKEIEQTRRKAEEEQQRKQDESQRHGHSH